MSTAPSIAGLILAGGRGERLGGVIKSELVVGAVRLLDRVAERLAGCDPLLVAHGPHAPALLRLSPGMIPVPDLDADYAGPLAGFAGAIAYLATLPYRPQLLVCAAVDAPFLPADYLQRLIDAIDARDAVIATHAGQAYPTNSIWRVERFLDLPARVLASTSPRSLKTLGAQADMAFLDWPEQAGADPFANINTPEDLKEMQRRATLSTALSRE